MPLSDIQKPDDSAIPQDVSSKEVLKNLSELLNDAGNRRRFLNSILDKQKQRPINWSKASNPPYYRERFAIELKKHLDEMLTDGEDRLYRYEDFVWLSKHSLYLMLNQAYRYLIDHLDPDEKYKAFRQLITITREKDSHGNPKGVRMSIMKDIRNNLPEFKAHKLSADAEIWREDMETFIEDGKENEVFTAKGLTLSPEECLDLETFLLQFPNIAANITSTQIKLVKVSV